MPITSSKFLFITICPPLPTSTYPPAPFPLGITPLLSVCHVYMFFWMKEREGINQNVFSMFTISTTTMPTPKNFTLH